MDYGIQLEVDIQANVEGMSDSELAMKPECQSHWQGLNAAYALDELSAHDSCGQICLEKFLGILQKDIGE